MRKRSLNASKFFTDLIDFQLLQQLLKESLSKFRIKKEVIYYVKENSLDSVDKLKVGTKFLEKRIRFSKANVIYYFILKTNGSKPEILALFRAVFRAVFLGLKLNLTMSIQN